LKKIDWGSVGGPIDGLKAHEFAEIRACAFAAMVITDLGARVQRVELTSAGVVVIR
jgi:crotonobetainyl-CoA:carnitine CoA-transferase CaiB-like acyl-CoA transferase